MVGEIETEVAQRWPLVTRLYIRPRSERSGAVAATS